MKRISSSFIRVIVALIIGCLLVLFPNQASDYVIITIGIVFLVSSLISLVSYFTQEKELRGHFPIEGIGCFLLALWLLIMPTFFANLLTILLGAILLLGGVQQIVCLSIVRRQIKVSMGFYVVPILLFLAGLFTLINPTGVRATALVIIGIGALLYAVTELIHWFLFTRKLPKSGDK